MAGAGIGGISAWLGITPLPTFAATGAALVALGLLVGPRVTIPPVALCGQVDAGLAGIFPQIVTVAARLDPVRAGHNIGRIAAVAYSGLFTGPGPVAIGAIVSGVGLRDALLVPAALAILVAAAAGVMRSR
jgi:hypothetical protein